MKRFEFVKFSKVAAVLLAIALTTGFLLQPPAVQAQTGKTYRVAYVKGPTAEGEAYFMTFRAAMRELGYVEGRNLILDAQVLGLENQVAATRVRELIAANPDVLVAWESIAQIMRAQTRVIPIVLAGGIDPVNAGLAQSLRQPGMNVTGSVQLNGELAAKHVDIIREILPRVARVGLFVDRTASGGCYDASGGCDHVRSCDRTRSPCRGVDSDDRHMAGAR